MKQIFNQLRKARAFWVIGLAASLTWIWAFFVDAAKLSESLVAGYGGIAIVYTVIVVLTTIIAYLFWGLIRRALDKPSWVNLGQVVLLWAAAELVIAWVISITSMGRGSSWDSMFPLFSLTPIIMQTPLGFLSRLLGYFGTSAAVGTVILVMFFGKRWRNIAIKFGTALLLANVILFGLYSHVNGGSVNTTIVSENLGKPRQIDMSGTDLVLVPEYGLESITSEGLANRFKHSDREVYFSGTWHTAKGGHYYNSLIYGSNTKGAVEQHYKSRLVIGSEYIPYGIEFVLKNFAPDTYYDFLNRRAIAPGKENSAPFELSSGEALGNAACSSILSTDDYRELTGNGATMLANSASLGVFNGSRQFEFYHSGLAKFMATANARPFLQAANDWDAFALDHNGREIARISPVDSKTVNIATNRKITPYTVIGESVAYAGIILLAIISVRKIREKKKKSRSLVKKHGL